MVYTSSPSNWFLRSKNILIGISKQGIREISRLSITSVTLPSEKDGVILDSIHNSFFQSLAVDAPTVMELCIPSSITVNAFDKLSGENPFPSICSFKKLVLNSIVEFHSAFIRLCFNESLEAIELLNSNDYVTIDGVVYSKDVSLIVFYPRSKKDIEFLLPKSVTKIGRYAFQNTRFLKRLRCASELNLINDYAFDNSSIEEFITTSGTIKDNVPQKDAFVNCRFIVPPIIPAITPEEAAQLTLESLQSSKLDERHTRALHYLVAVNDDIADALLCRLKSDDKSAFLLRACAFCIHMDQSPMTEKIYNVYKYLADDPSNYLKELNRSYLNDDLKHRLEIIHNSIEQFKLYQLTGFKGEMQREDAFKTGCCIFGEKPNSLNISENEAKEWLTAQIQDAIRNGSKLFITKTCIGICCLGAEIIIELKKRNPSIKLLLLSDLEYEYEIVGPPRYDTFLHKRIYDQRISSESLLWKPRLEAVKEKADMVIRSWKDNRNEWVHNHCGQIIAIWKRTNGHENLVNQATDKGITTTTFFLPEM